MKTLFQEKLKESFFSVLPIALIIFALSVTLTSLPTDAMLLFFIGVASLVVGLSLFTMGAEMSMTVLGTKVGSVMAESKKIWLIALISFVIGITVTVSEPDLQILANQVSQVPNLILILTVSVGVGVFLVFGVLRIIFHVNLTILLFVFYLVAFVLCFFISPDFLSVAFDSGGVTTGPMTVPFIMAIGAGLSQIVKDCRDDSFGLIALCSIGPILSVLILGIAYSIEGGEYEISSVITYETTRDCLGHYVFSLPDYAKEVGKALLPILFFTIALQIVTKAFAKKKIIRIFVGLLYTYVGLVLFLTGANEGFLTIGTLLGQNIADIMNGWLLIPVTMLIGYFIVKAEPSVYILNKQVENITAGAISARQMGFTLSIGVSLALGLSMLRVITGISILWILVPGYLIAFLLTFFVPKMFVGIAFDSGGVASGTMMSAFVLPLAIGACNQLNGNIMTDAFGCVAFVALTPILTIQFCGVLYNRKTRIAKYNFLTEKETFVDYTEEDICQAE